jgi:flagellar protein FlgJ
MARASTALPLDKQAAREAVSAGQMPAGTTGRSETEKAELRKAANAFEAIFLRQMIGAMRAATPGDSLLGSSASDQFRDLMDARIAEDMAAKQDLGIAEMVLKQFGVDER